jgi:lipopolysaccharide export system protein LptC
MNDAAPKIAPKIAPMTGPMTATRGRLGGIGAPRADAIPDARRHTARVARLRRFIVWAAGGVVALVLLALGFQALSFLPADLRFAHIALKGTRITIETPKIVGYRQDGRPFEIRARLGAQDMARPDTFELEGLEVRIENADDNTIKMSSGKGVYNAKNERAEFSDGVSIRDDKNFDMRMEAAVMDFKASVMTSDRPVKLMLHGGEVTAKSVEFMHKERRAAFVGEVHSVLYGEQDDDAPAQARQAGK